MISATGPISVLRGHVNTVVTGMPVAGLAKEEAGEEDAKDYDDAR
jgi:hypothetical protein